MKTHEFLILLTELGSPRRYPDQLHYPDGPASTSWEAYGRHDDDELEAELLHAVSAKKKNMKLVVMESLPEGVSYLDRRGFHELKLNDGIQLVNTKGVIIGRVDGEKIAPIFNTGRKFIRIDYNHNPDGTQIIMDDKEARLWGVFGTVEEFNKRVRAADHPLFQKQARRD